MFGVGVGVVPGVEVGGGAAWFDGHDYWDVGAFCLGVDRGESMMTRS